VHMPKRHAIAVPLGAIVTSYKAVVVDRQNMSGGDMTCACFKNFNEDVCNYSVKNSDSAKGPVLSKFGFEDVFRMPLADWERLIAAVPKAPDPYGVAEL